MNIILWEIQYLQEYIIEKEGEYPTSLWYCVTTLYGGHDLCNDIHEQSGFTICPTAYHSSCSYCTSAVLASQSTYMPTNS